MEDLSINSSIKNNFKAEFEETKVSFEEFPKEILFQIFSYLEKLSDQKTFSLLNKECNLVAKNFPLYELCLRICKLEFFFPWKVPVDDSEIIRMTFPNKETSKNFHFTSSKTNQTLRSNPNPNNKNYESNQPKWIWKDGETVSILFDDWLSNMTELSILHAGLKMREKPFFENILLPSSFQKIFNLEDQIWKKTWFYFDQTTKIYYSLSKKQNQSYIKKTAISSNSTTLFTINQVFLNRIPLLVKEDPDQFSLLFYQEKEQILEVFTQKKTEKKEEELIPFSKKISNIQSLYHGSSFSSYVALKESFEDSAKIHLLNLEKKEKLITIQSPKMKKLDITNVIVKPKEKALIIFYINGFEIYDFKGNLFSEKFNIQFTSPVIDARKILYFYDTLPFHPSENRKPGRIYKWDLSEEKSGTKRKLEEVEKF